MELDIRNGAEVFTSIRVAPANISTITADVIKPSGDYRRVHLLDSDSHDYLAVHGEEHAKNLILGLQKAIDLGWLK